MTVVKEHSSISQKTLKSHYKDQMVNTVYRLQILLSTYKRFNTLGGENGKYLNAQQMIHIDYHWGEALAYLLHLHHSILYRTYQYFFCKSNFADDTLITQFNKFCINNIQYLIQQGGMQELWS